MKYSLGISPCPNDTFIFDALLHDKIDCGDLRFSPRFEDVQKLNELALEQQLDIIKVSFHTLLLITQDYWLMRAGSALGKGCGPLLISDKPRSNEELRNCTIALPGELTTAHLLFQLAYPGIDHKKFMLFSEIEDAILEGKVDAGVIIHENRFTYREKGLIALRDLGSYWEQKTNTPIPLGGIAIRKSVGRQEARRIEHCLRNSVKYAFKHPNASREFVLSHAQEMNEAICQKHIDTYVTPWSEWLGDEGEQAVEELFNYAHSIELIEQIPPDLYP